MPPLHFSTIKAPTSGTDTGPGNPSHAVWSNPNNITADDGNSASIGFFSGGQQGDTLNALNFGFDVPTNAIIDGFVVSVEGSQLGTYGNIQLTHDGGSGTKPIGTLNGDFGDSEDMWGTTATPADVNGNNLSVEFFTGDVSGGDGIASIEYVTVTIFWHYDFDVPPAEVPKRYDYKVYSNDGTYLGNLPKVITPFGFSEDIETAGATMALEVGLNPDISRDPSKVLTTELGEPITTESGQRIMVDGASSPITIGTDTDNNSLIKNGNRIVIYEYSYYYPNGKAMYSGQIVKVGGKFGGQGSGTIKLLLWNDATELDHYPARGVPPDYTEQQAQTVRTDDFNVTQEGDKGAGYNRCGQTITVVGGNIAAIQLGVEGTARVTVTLFDEPNGQALTSTSMDISSVGHEQLFSFPDLIEGLGSAFIAVSVDPGQSIRIARNTAGGYVGGEMYSASYAGGGGGAYGVVSGQDMYFRAYSGVVTTTAAFTGEDPTTGMLVPIMDDYNLQGGRIVATDVDPTGLSLNYEFKVQTIFEVLKAVRDMAPENFYWRIDMGTDELEFKEISTTPDFTLIRGIHINELELWLTIENVKNKLLFSGGDSGGGNNLYKQYTDPNSMQLYGVRLDRKSDNRVTVSTTADAIGESFIDENAPEKQQTTITIPSSVMDITLLTPGKVVGFANFGSFIDQMQLLIVRRDYTPDAVTLTVGTLRQNLPVTVEQLKRSMVAEQTVANPDAPS